MKPQEITEENWSEKLDDYDRGSGPLVATVREHLSIEGQCAMRTLRDMLPKYLPPQLDQEQEVSGT
jgi:hypothetical protein